MRKKRANFTLIELLVVLSIIALVTTAMHFSFTRFLSTKKIEKELFCLKQTFFLAQDLMVNSRLSSKIVLKQASDRIEVVFYPSHSLPSKLVPFPSSYSCKEIKSLLFNDQKANEIILHFDGHLGCTSSGMLKLIDKNDKEHLLVFKGFPSRLHA